MPETAVKQNSSMSGQSSMATEERRAAEQGLDDLLEDLEDLLPGVDLPDLESSSSPKTLGQGMDQRGMQSWRSNGIDRHA
jgi:hypothetical protein